VIDERHATLRVLLPLRADEALADDAGALDGTGDLAMTASRRKASRIQA